VHIDKNIAEKRIRSASIIMRVANQLKMIRDSPPLFVHCDGVSRSTLACVRQGWRTGAWAMTIANV
jgi:hypothetical protein